MRKKRFIRLEREEISGLKAYPQKMQHYYHKGSEDSPHGADQDH